MNKEEVQKAVTDFLKENVYEMINESMHRKIDDILNQYEHYHHKIVEFTPDGLGILIKDTKDDTYTEWNWKFEISTQQ
jgi:ribose 5-phosphate isomerase RpiB